MIEGYGNNPEDGVEGMRYKNTIGSYSHGPVLKNQNIAKAIAKMIVANHKKRIGQPVQWAHIKIRHSVNANNKITANKSTLVRELLH